MRGCAVILLLLLSPADSLAWILPPVGLSNPSSKALGLLSYPAVSQRATCDSEGNSEVGSEGHDPRQIAQRHEDQDQGVHQSTNRTVTKHSKRPSEILMASVSTSPDDHGSVHAPVSPRPSPPSEPSDVSTQETGVSTTATPLAQEVPGPRYGMTSTIRAMNDDDPPNPPFLQVADQEKESEGPQLLHDGPPGPPRFPQELDDSLAMKVDEERAALTSIENRLQVSCRGEIAIPPHICSRILQQEDIGSGERVDQETRGGTNVGDMTAAPIVQEEVIQGSVMVSTIRAMSDDDPPIPVWQDADYESEDNQVNSVEIERNLSDRPLDNAVTVHSTMGAHFVNTADVDPPVVVGTDTSTYTTLLPGAAGREATNSGAANAGTRAIVIPQATVVTPEDDDGPKPTIVASIVLPFYRRKGFVYVMVAMALLGLLVIGIATAVQLSNSGSETYPAHHQAKLLAPDGTADDKFGLSVAIYVDPDGSADDRFGMSVAIYEDIIVVGADGDGSAHVFFRSGEEWAHQAK
ncbi:hypothetical protein THAOC_19371, partial [Thalassiosira oceanica]